MDQKNKYSFRKSPKLTNRLDRFKNSFENAKNHIDEMKKMLPGSLRFISISPMQKFAICLSFTGFCSYRLLKSMFLF
jgi:hypothetical protein